MTVNHPWALWASGFFGAVCAVHAVPLIVRHDLVIAGVVLSTPTAGATAGVALLLSLAGWRYAKGS